MARRRKQSDRFYGVRGKLVRTGTTYLTAGDEGPFLTWDFKKARTRARELNEAHKPHGGMTRFKAVPVDAEFRFPTK